MKRSGLGAALLGLALSARAASGLWALPGEFLDESGRARRLAEFAEGSELTIAAMEYTECRFVCSIAWRRLLDVQTEADKLGRKVRFLVISLDPEHDTPALWREYRKLRGIQRDNWVFLTGKRPATDQAIAQLGVHWWRYDGNLMHDFRIVRVGAQGQTVRVLDNYDQPPASLLRD